jgi:hypothetical protein
MTRSIVPGLVAAAVALAAGCEKKPAHPPPQHTRGTLTYNGKPLKGAVVTFWPLPLDNVSWRTLKPAARTEADGTYQVNSFDLADGAAVGQYAVTVMWMGENDDVPRPDFFQGKYSNASKPVLTVTIKEGHNEVPPIALTGPPIKAIDVPGVPGT